jgi:hypothetical protein
MDDSEALVEQRLGALLRGSKSGPDEMFVARVQRQIEAELRMNAEHKASWRRFASEAVASLAVAAAFLLAGRMTPPTGEVDLLTFGPAMAASLLIVFWLAIGIAPASQRKMPEGL